jgi:hypothetical protein
MGYQFEAQFEGRCAGGDRIDPSQRVEYVGADLYHVDCVPRHLLDDKPGKFDGTTEEQMGF